jgi:hypothetical protein
MLVSVAVLLMSAICPFSVMTQVTLPSHHCDLGFDPWTRRNMRVEFVVDSLPCLEGFPLSAKINISQFQFDLWTDRNASKSTGSLASASVKQRRFFY